MKISPHEHQAIREVCRYGASHGYSNMISHLKAAWAKSLLRSTTAAGAKWTEKDAQEAAGGGGYPIKMHEDLMENGEWDESGERYRLKRGPKVNRHARKKGAK